MTGDFTLTLPVMLDVEIATSRGLSYSTIYTTKLLRHGTDIDRVPSADPFQDLTAADAMLRFPAPLAAANGASGLAGRAGRWPYGRYHGPAGSDYSASSVAVSPAAGTVFVTGTSRVAPARSDYATAAYDAATGAQRWASRYSGPAGHADSARSVAVSPGGATVFVTGTSHGATSSSDYATVAYDATTGARRWARRYNGPASCADCASSLAVSPGGSAVFVTGTSSAGTLGCLAPSDYVTVAYSAATGARLWTSRYTGPAGDSAASALAVSPDGTKVFITGTSQGDYATVAYQR